MRTVTLFASLPLVAVSTAFGIEVLATDYNPERALRVVTVTELEVETTDMSVTVNGEPMDWGGGGGWGWG